MLLATPVQIRVGWRFYVAAFHALRGGAANMDVLIAPGTSMAFGFSATVTIGGFVDQHVYFDASAAIVTPVLPGKLPEARAKGRTTSAIEQLIELHPGAANVERVSITTIQPDDVVVVGAGERLPTDGIVLDGAAMAMSPVSVVADSILLKRWKPRA